MELLPELPRQYNAVELQKILNDFMQRAVGDNIVNYVDRGDPTAYDFTEASLTTDGTWVDLNLSAIIPVGTKAVLIYFEIKDDAVESYLSFRKNGNSNVYNSLSQYTQVVSKYVSQEGIVVVDNNRTIEYQASNLTFTNINVLIRGWFI